MTTLFKPTTSTDILIVDDEADIGLLIEGILSDEGFKTRKALNADKAVTLAVPADYTTLLVVLQGAVRVGESEPITEAQVGICDRVGNQLILHSLVDTKALLLCGEPIAEPIVGQGPFVMNSPAEIYQAMADYQSGKMGSLAPND
ncbi:MAG TPA: hypothetical protein IGR64_01615 [Leptolyngbyaceae cyanobacterium M65_K2018_010]|nr:hypothetical protein [Leptolyngbyaceae cyanobacterium M65_K2018_010]